MIFTSNYARHNNSPKAISISKKPPSYFNGEHLEFLAPTWDMISNHKLNKIDDNEYTRMYISLLEQRQVDAKQLIELLPDESILLCYEAPKDFCHRHVLAEWIERETGIKVVEWKNEKEQQQFEQDRLVDDLFDL